MAKISYKAHDKTLKDGARIGWVFPLEYPLKNYIRIISQFKSSKNEIDEFFTEYFHSDFEKTVKTPIRQYYSEIPKHIESLLEECFISYENGHYQICVPALFATLEGLLIELSNGQDRVNTKYTKGIRDKIQTLGENPKILPLTSIAFFLEMAFCQSNFNETEIDMINRHWSQHGRYITELPKKSPLQLFDAVALVLFAKNFIEGKTAAVESNS
ncbi:hypothetical protein ACSVIJ_07085 [Pseudomonas sp. NCHU5208]|uniref:hypothetical protein n=1 Tax=unclassified Pseudomonas TaxID=196821 RepID=UPI003F990CF9